MATARVSVRARPARPADGFRTVTTVVSLVAPLVLITVVLVVGSNAVPAIRHFGAGFLVSRAWNPVKDSFGALPFIYGTLVSAFLGLAMALPVGVGVAIFLAEQGLPRLRGAIGTGVELLAAIPSVVYGIWGLYVLAPWLLTHFSKPVSEHAGEIPVLGVVLAGPARQTNLLIAGIVVAVMVLPTLASISRDVIRAVPGGLREASVALGATWWETVWKVVLPAARAGIFGATVLALGRALGETMAVTMTIGNRPDIPTSLLSPAYTLASVIANEFSEATGTLYPAALIELGLVLMLVTLVVNVLALLLVRRVTRDVKL
ncbi:MAG TPA: phosphate ABC transporter permease subunit PstC [Candidatus Dormibacteraeota bacterium]|nr:phosphate ABC transporter permease subunit PstC [Candidatus Dormibacteraeota bacterium]